MSSNSDSINEIIDRIDCLQRNVAGLHQSQTNSLEALRKMINEAIEEFTKDFRDLRRSILSTKSGCGEY